MRNELLIGLQRGKDMKKLSKKTAYWITYLLWKWLAKTGSQFKNQWPGWYKWVQIYGAHFFTVNSWCPLCGYYGVEYPIKKCQACYDDCKSLWFKSLVVDVPCEKPLSLYTSWKTARSTEERKKHATVMAKELKRIHGGL
jgi:hypothetical protein